MELIIIIGFAIILGSLASALFFMMSRRREPRLVVRALMVRVAVSIGLFVFILLTYKK